MKFHFLHALDENSSIEFYHSICGHFNYACTTNDAAKLLQFSAKTCKQVLWEEVVECPAIAMPRRVQPDVC